MKTGKKFGDRIFISWTDACETTGWQSVADASRIPDECQCRTAGFFVCENKDFIHVTHTIGKSPKNDIGSTMRIPKKWIKKVL